MIVTSNDFFLSLSLDGAPEKPLGAMPEKVVK